MMNDDTSSNSGQMRLSMGRRISSAARTDLKSRHNHIASRSWIKVLIVAVAALFLIVGSVHASSTKVDRSVVLEQPRVANGMILKNDGSIAAEDLAELLEAIGRQASEISPSLAFSTSAVVAQANSEPAPAQEQAEPTAAKEEAKPDPAKEQPEPVPAKEQPTPAPAKAEPKPAVAVPESKPLTMSTLITLPKLSMTEIREMGDQLVLHLESGLGYVAASTALVESLPASPAGLIGARAISRSAEDGTHILRFGYRYFVSQPPQLWVHGAIVADGAAPVANPDLLLVAPEVTKMIASLTQMRDALTVRDLEVKLIQLSYVDADSALSMLATLGVTTMDKAAATKVEFAKLPYVVKMTDPAKEYTGLIGGKTETAGGKLSMTPGVASEMSDNTIASPLTQLLVMFHPAHPEQFSEVRHILDTLVDRPARQIFIEAMVLEISEEGLEELGVEWELSDPVLNITGGSLNAGLSTDTININAPDTSLLHRVFNGGFLWDWELTIRALIREGKAEILSRPSVLTLNNRQSTIRVGRDIPIASSLEGMSSYSNRVSFAFTYLPTGILLNIRPRINESGSEVSMLIDTIVSARVPGGDLELRAADDLLLASAPTVATRRVQTYGRIANNTPLIIGGLVARELIVTQDKVPFLGDLPIIGAAFRSEKTENLKREVIIVLTPHVLPEKKEVRRSFPKDEDYFDSFGHDLFRDSYRIRSEDVFDLTFLLENQRISSYRRMARQVVEKNFRIGEAEPFRSFVKDSVPGESILVTRMIYEVIKRLDVAEKIEPSKIIYFASQQVGGYDVEYIADLMKAHGADEDENGIRGFKDKALAITYQYDRHSLEEGRLGSEPIPDISLIDCPNREAWATKLWELNQPSGDGRLRHTIVVQNDSDILRLRRALALKKIVLLNGGAEQMRLRNFSVGKVLLMPELKSEQIHVVDADTARFFFHTEHYYAAALGEIEKQLKQLDTMLHRPEIKILLDPDVNLDGQGGSGK